MTRIGIISCAAFAFGCGVLAVWFLLHGTFVSVVLGFVFVWLMADAVVTGFEILTGRRVYRYSKDGF